MLKKVENKDNGNKGKVKRVTTPFSLQFKSGDKSAVKSGVRSLVNKALKYVFGNIIHHHNSNRCECIVI